MRSWADLIAQDGVKKLAIAVFNDEYGTVLRDIIVKTASDGRRRTSSMAKRTRSIRPKRTSHRWSRPSRPSNPDATLVIAFDQTKPLLKALASAGSTPRSCTCGRQHLRLFRELDAGLLKGSTGTIPGINPTDDFVKHLKSTGVDLKNTTTYSAETYDAIILAALAAQKGGADGTTIQTNMAVSGSTKGKKCDSYKACVALLKDGKEIQYKGQTSIGAFNDAHDPSSASIGVYKYDADNKPVFDHSQEGSVPKA